MLQQKLAFLDAVMVSRHLDYMLEHLKARSMPSPHPTFACRPARKWRGTCKHLMQRWRRRGSPPASRTAARVSTSGS